MLLIFDTSVFEGELTSCQEVCILYMQHVMKYVSAMTLSFIFVFYGIDYICFMNFKCSLLFMYNLVLLYG